MSILTPPAQSLCINGGRYPIDTDYRAWLKVIELIEEMEQGADDEFTVQRNIAMFSCIEKIIFGKVLQSDAELVQSAVTEFMRGYPESGPAGRSGSDSGSGALISFVHDIDLIILAIRNQSGIDLSYRRAEPFHFWDFLLEFQSLEERHQISKIVSYRAYDGEDEELCKKRALYALPVKKTKAEQKEAEEINALFYGG